ncbi:hypothetical protein [Nitrosomonas ureae]|uniref:Uncharacterized protein n=1 Tax=Nitrosomonas ureae TaxID=44577 RepID=A0A286A206_9PROT|nr:hypothetical protein [Nitrosomonas ureae]SOD15943.1 hypothetical protein SAMN06297164_0155 [Nitrosomonas ureae]
MKNKNFSDYEIDLSTSPPSCLPAGMDKSNFRDITRRGDQWKRYLDVETGKEHDCSEYFAESQRLNDL